MQVLLDFYCPAAIVSVVPARVYHEGSMILMVYYALTMAVSHSLCVAVTLFLTMLVGSGGNAGAQAVIKAISMISSGHTPSNRLVAVENSNTQSCLNFEFKYVPRENVGIHPIVMGHKKKKKGIDARFIKVKAKNFGKLPKGHPGYDFNGDAFIFIDEVLINPEVAEML
jgi:hypothetical protein